MDAALRLSRPQPAQRLLHAGLASPGCPGHAISDSPPLAVLQKPRRYHVQFSALEPGQTAPGVVQDALLTKDAIRPGTVRAAALFCLLIRIVLLGGCRDVHLPSQPTAGLP